MTEMTEWNATEHHRQSSPRWSFAEQQIARLNLSGRERVLDVGCGDGKITAAIAERVPGGSVVGIDVSRETISAALVGFAGPVRPNLRFEVADVRSLRYRREFDLIVSFNALDWVTDQGAALRSMRAALTLGGRMLLRFVSRGPRRSLEDVFEDVRAERRWARYFVGFSAPHVHFAPHEYGGLAARHGLRALRLAVHDEAWVFATGEAFAALCRASFAEWTRRLPEREAPVFIAEVLERYRQVASRPHDQAHTLRFYQMEVLLARMASADDLREAWSRA